MPEIRYYTVTQEREVKVAANSAADAVLIADAAFTHGQDSNHSVAKGKSPEGVWGNTRTEVRVRDISAREEY